MIRTEKFKCAPPFKSVQCFKGDFGVALSGICPCFGQRANQSCEGAWGCALDLRNGLIVILAFELVQRQQKPRIAIFRFNDNDFLRQRNGALYFPGGDCQEERSFNQNWIAGIFVQSPVQKFSGDVQFPLGACVTACQIIAE